MANLWPKFSETTSIMSSSVDQNVTLARRYLLFSFHFVRWSVRLYYQLTSMLCNDRPYFANMNTASFPINVTASSSVGPNKGNKVWHFSRFYHDFLQLTENCQFVAWCVRLFTLWGMASLKWTSTLQSSTMGPQAFEIHWCEHYIALIFHLNSNQSALDELHLK
jgi:hypothetical protein